MYLLLQRYNFFVIYYNYTKKKDKITNSLCLCMVFFDVLAMMVVATKSCWLPNQMMLVVAIKSCWLPQSNDVGCSNQVMLVAPIK